MFQHRFILHWSQFFHGSRRKSRAEVPENRKPGAQETTEENAGARNCENTKRRAKKNTRKKPQKKVTKKRKTKLLKNSRI